MAGSTLPGDPNEAVGNMYVRIITTFNLIQEDRTTEQIRSESRPSGTTPRRAQWQATIKPKGRTASVIN